MTTPEGLDLEALLARCEAEPIHAPGAIQPHGALLAVDHDGTISATSANTGEVLGVDAALLLGATLHQVLGSAQAEAVLAEDRFEVVTLQARGLTLDVVTHTSPGGLLVELEPSSGVEVGDHWRLYRALRAFHGSPSVADVLAGAVRTVARAHRLRPGLLYEFDPEWNGEVVAEDAAPGVDRFLGPALPGQRHPAAGPGPVPAQPAAPHPRRRGRPSPSPC